MIRNKQEELTLLEVTDGNEFKSKTVTKAQLSQSVEKMPPSATIKENSQKDLRIARLELMILELSKKLDGMANPGLRKEMLI
jgi:hypothetical protein